MTRRRVLTTELHALRSAQLKALARIPRNVFSRDDADRMFHYCHMCVNLRLPYGDPAQYDTRNLSDKALEEIQTLASKYLEQVK